LPTFTENFMQIRSDVRFCAKLLTDKQRRLHWTAPLYCVLIIVCISLLHYLAIHPSRLQVCSNKIRCQMLSDFQNYFTDRSSSKYHIQPHIKRIATQPCEILMPENWRRSEMYIVIFSNYIKWLSLA